jgi:hypothetical protein
MLQTLFGHPFIGGERMRSRVIGSWICGLAVLALPAMAALEPRGREIRLGVGATGRQVLPAAAASAAGTAIVWEHELQGLRGVFLAAGAAAGDEKVLVANDGPPSLPFEGEVISRRQPAVAFAPNGDLVVAWTEERAHLRAAPFLQDREVLEQDILVQRFDATGTALGRRFRINANPAGMQNTPRLAAHAGGFVAVWLDASGVAARALDVAGRPIGAETRVSEAAGLRPAIAFSQGRALVVWDGPDADEIGVFSRLLDNGARVAGPVQRVNVRTQDKQARATVAADGAGGFLVGWQSEHPEQWSGFYYVYGRKVTEAGVPTGGEVRLYSGSIGAGAPQIAPALAAIGRGRYLLTWIGWKNSFGPDVAGGELDASGAADGAAAWLTERRVRSTFRELAVASHGGGHVAVWESSDRNWTLSLRRLGSN